MKPPDPVAAECFAYATVDVPPPPRPSIDRNSSTAREIYGQLSENNPLRKNGIAEIQAFADRIRATADDIPTRRRRFLIPLACVLPLAERDGWIEEQRSCLAEESSRIARWMWIRSTICGLPRYAYTLHTDRNRERT